MDTILLIIYVPVLDIFQVKLPSFGLDVVVDPEAAIFDESIGSLVFATDPSTLLVK
jgi:hypothetical protein